MATRSKSNVMWAKQKYRDEAFKHYFRSDSNKKTFVVHRNAVVLRGRLRWYKYLNGYRFGMLRSGTAVVSQMLHFIVRVADLQLPDSIMPSHNDRGLSSQIHTHINKAIDGPNPRVTLSPDFEHMWGKIMYEANTASWRISSFMRSVLLAKSTTRKVLKSINRVKISTMLDLADKSNHASLSVGVFSKDIKSCVCAFLV